MKRPIVIVAAVYVAGLSAGGFFRLPPVVVLAAVGLIAASQAVLLWRGRRAVNGLLFAAVFLLGVLQHHRVANRAEAGAEILSRLDDTRPMQVEARLVSTDRTYETRQVYRLEGCTFHVPDGSAIEFPMAVQLVCSGAAFEALRALPPRPGDRVSAAGRLRSPPDLENPDVFNYRAYLEHHGIGASLFVRDPDDLAVAPPAVRSPIDWFVGAGEELRRHIESTLDADLEPEAAHLVRSIFLGQAYRLEPDLRSDFVRCGVAHIFAVSGLHVGLVVWVFVTFFKILGLNPRWRSLMIILVLAVFASVVGFRAPVFRASLMIGFLAGTHWIRTRIEPLTALATAAFVILVLSPQALWQAGFQLSFVCMLSIILLKPPLDAWLRIDTDDLADARRRRAGFVNPVVSMLTLVLAAQIGLIPLLAHYYHRVPVVGLLSNLIAAPIVWMIIAGAIALTLLGPFVPAIAAGFAGALNMAAGLLAGVIQLVAALPAASILMPSWPVWIAVAYYLFLFGWAVLPHEPSPFFLARQRARMAIAGAAVAAWVVWAPAVLHGGGERLRATFLDVGQGDSCLLELPGGPVVLVDGGDSRSSAGRFVVVPFLESRGIDRLDAVIATHPDSDHIGGLPAVFDGLRVDWLIEGPGRNETDVYARLLEAVVTEPAERETVHAGDWIEAPRGVRLDILHPSRDALYSNRNDTSLVLRVDWRDCEILIPGDIEGRAERDLVASGRQLVCDVLKVAHHGSAEATSAEFLERARPALAVISCGKDNSFGHPRPEVLERLVAAGVPIVRTDQDGAVTVLSDGRSVVCTAHGGKRRGAGQADPRGAGSTAAGSD